MLQQHYRFGFFSTTAALVMKAVRSVISSFAVLLVLGFGVSASATITSISSDWCHSCLPGSAHRIAAGTQASMLVKGQFVDGSTRVEISGSGVTVSFGDRTHGSNSSIEVRFDVANSASLGDRTVKLRYAVEINGPDTFQVKIVRGGRVDKIERSFTGRLLPVDAIPVNQRVTLVFTGARLGNASIATNQAINNPQILSSSETRCEVELEINRTGAVDINIVDADVGPQPGNLLFKFFYGGAKRITAVGVASPITNPIPHIPTSGPGPSATFVDVAPRANILNLFRGSGTVTVNGEQFLRVEDRWCSDNGLQTPATGSAVRTITVPDLVWGVTNVGTAEVNIGFVSQLSSNGQVLQTQTTGASTLLPGATQNFSFQRTRSVVRVIRFAPPNQQGCFVNPRDTDFFQDPQFLVKVDTGNAVPETATNRINNARNY